MSAPRFRVVTSSDVKVFEIKVNALLDGHYRVLNCIQAAVGGSFYAFMRRDPEPVEDDEA